MAKKINYSEGDCFSVPLRSGGFARGIISRMDGKGIVFGSFFGPLIENENDLAVDTNLQSGMEILKGQFGDPGMLENEWKRIGHVENWSRDSWPLPQFLRWENGDKKGILCTYDENSLLSISEDVVVISDIDVIDYPPDGLMGYGFVEIKLTKLLASSQH